jgi:lambda family phage tail tape measure protein
VASYSAVINVSVSGQAALDKLEGSARSIQTLIQGIKQQKNIFDQAVGSEKTRELKKNLDSLVTSFAAAQDGARQFEVVVGGKTRKVNMYSKTLAGLSHQLGTFRAISDNATVGTDRFVNSLIAANKVSNELARTQARAMTAGTGVTGTPQNVQEVLALGRAIPNTIQGLTFYRSKLEDLIVTLDMASGGFRAVEEAIESTDVRLRNARLTGQTSAITPAAGPASRTDTVESYGKRAAFAQKVADLEYKQLLTGQQIVKSKLDETQQAELQNRLEQASQALAEGDLALAKRLTNELRNQRIQYERINRDREALMRPTSMVAGASLPVRGGKDIIDSPINLQEGTKAAVALAQQKLKATGPEKAEASQKRLNNLLNSALIAEQAIIKTAKKGIDVKDEQAQIQSVITKLQQLDVTATKAELSLYDDLLNAVRNELKLKKAIAATDAASAKSTKAKAKTQTKTKGMGLSDALIGAAFPLLFGQGIGAAAGGGLGGFAGAKIAGGKGGFGGSLAGTLVGQATIDFAINSAVELGQALRKPTENIEQLTKFLGIAGTELGTNVSVLQKLGLQSTASATALAKLEEILKAEGYKNLDTLSKQLTDLENAFSGLKLAAANLLSEPLTQFLNFLTDTIKLISRAGGVGGFITTSPEKLQAIDKQIQAERKGATDLQGAQPTQAELAAQKAITDEKQRQITLATAQKNLEADKLNLTRVDLATRQGAIAVQQVQNDLARKQLEYRNETTEAAKELLGLEVQVLQQQEAQAQAAQRNAIAEAERAVRQQKRGLFVDQIGLTNQFTEAKTEAEKIINGEAAGLASSILSTEARLSNERLILRARQAIEEEGVKENDVLKEIRVKYALLHQLAIERSANEHDVKQQLLAQYYLTQKQIEQQRQLANLETKGVSKQELQRTQSFQDPTGLVPFFGDALINEKLALEDYNLTLDVYNKKLTDLQENAAREGLNTDLGKGLNQQADALKDQIALYREYQPAIIQARLEQEKFNAILSAITPVVDNLFDSISNVVAGTMTAKEAFASFLNSVADMLADTAKKMIAQYIAIGIARMFAGFAPGVGNAASPEAYAVGTGASIEVAAKGATFSNGIAKFARGGIVDSPTLFKFAQGGAMQTGLMGEAGPEAIMPLTRGPGGQLGVSNFGGGGDVNVVVNVDAKGSSVEGNEQGANQLGRVISAAVQSELIKQQRPGGILAR